MSSCRYAESSLGLQERVVMEHAIGDAMADGTELPNDPVIRQLAEQMKKDKRASPGEVQ